MYKFLSYSIYLLFYWFGSKDNHCYII